MIDPDGETIRAMRIARGWTQQQFARRLDASQASVSRFESGGKVPKQMLGRILEILECSASEFEKRVESTRAWLETMR